MADDADPTIEFTLVSDLHVDFAQPRIELPDTNLLVVAGDTANGLEGLRLLTKWRDEGVRTVFAVDGNHEHYANLRQRRTVEDTRERFREEFPGRVEYGVVPFVLTNGWYPVTDEDQWYDYMNDGRYSCLRWADVNALAINEAAYVQQALEEWRAAGITGVVVTHTSPCEETLDPRFDGHYSNQWYWNPNMRALLAEYREQIRVWCHGHTHTSQDKIVDGVRVVCNPRGYPRENPNWAPVVIQC